MFRYVFYAAIVAFVVTRPELRRVWSQLDQPRRRFLGTLFVLLLLGQASGLKYATYPFVKWGMYDEAGSNVKWVEYRGVDSKGSEIPFPIAQLVRTHTTPLALECPTCGKRLLWRMRRFTKDMEDLPPGPERDAIFDLYQRTLQAAWLVYRQRRPDADFVSVRMFRNRTTVDDYRAGLPHSSDFLWEVDLEASGETR